MTDAGFVIVGRIRKPHGIRGDVIVEPITDEPDAIFAAGRRVFGGTVTGDPPRGGEAPPLVIERVQPYGDGLIAHFDAIPDRTQAERWRERYLLLPLTEVRPPADDEVFLHELVGMRVELPTGEPVGEVLEVYELPQGLALDVRWRGGSVLLPWRDDLVRSLRRAERLIVMEVPAGLLE
jgi:16S rRNA processing protein RimM